MTRPQAGKAVGASEISCVQAPTTFYLVRHAYAPWPGAGGRSTYSDRPLSAEGQQAARALADHLTLFPIERIVSSDALRARQTIEPLAQRLGLDVEEEPDLRERSLAAAPFPGIGAFREAVRAAWRDPHFAHPGGETNTAAQTRAVAVLARLLAGHAGARIAISTHGNLLALMLQHYDPSVDVDFWASLTMPDLVVLTIKADGETIWTRPVWRD